MHGFESIIILRTVVEAHENIRAGQPGEICRPTNTEGFKETGGETIR